MPSEPRVYFGARRAPPPPAGARPPRLSREVEHDHLQLGHLEHGVGRPLLAEAGLLEAAIGHEIRAPLRSPVDVEVSRLDFARELPRPLQVIGEDPCRETELGVVSQRY